MFMVVEDEKLEQGQNNNNFKFDKEILYGIVGKCSLESQNWARTSSLLRFMYVARQVINHYRLQFCHTKAQG